MTALRNFLIEALPRAERTRVLADCQQVELELGTVLCEAGQPSRHVWFPTAGFVSLVAVVKGSPGVEVGMVGSEGMLGTQVALGVATAPLLALVQGAGTAWRMGAGAFKKEIDRSPALRRRLDRYLYVLMAQLATSAACLRFHEIGPRLARWLLMMQDRAGADRFRVTHEFLAFMLGVRRAGISRAAGSLQHAGLIEYRRGDF
ncbi:MAG: Crp/Fnr family transcriptional regulator, partial [Caldimonas sp.]